MKTLGSPEGVPKEERWLAENDRELEEAAGAAREGMTFFCVKGREKETKEKETNETKETQGGLREGS